MFWWGDVEYSRAKVKDDRDGRGYQPVRRAPGEVKFSDIGE